VSNIPTISSHKVAQSNQEAKYFRRKSISSILCIFGSENCKQGLTAEKMKILTTEQNL